MRAAVRLSLFSSKPLLDSVFFMSRSTETSYLLIALRDLNYLIIRHVTKARRPIIVYTVQYVVLGPAGFTL